MRYFKKLVGEKLYLSPRSSEDVELYTKWLNDFETTDYIGKSRDFITLDGEKKYLEEPIEAYVFSIVTLDEDKMIGNISLEKIDHLNQRGTLGIFIGEKDYRGKGYGTEAIKLILDYGFNYLNLKNIKLDLMEFNERAYFCYKKCGFKEYGRRRKCNFLNGRYYDTIEMDILAEEFQGHYIKNKNI